MQVDREFYARAKETSSMEWIQWTLEKGMRKELGSKQDFEEKDS